jgi:hypothetical protein
MRLIQDAALQNSTPLPAAGATAQSATIDIGNPKGGEYEGFEVQVQVPVTPSLADAHTLTATLQDSADNITFASIPELAAFVITGGGGIGGPAFIDRWRLPSSARRYLQVQYAVQAGGGNNTAIQAVFSLTT